MRHELDEALCAKYPKIFANRHGDMRTTAMCWGFDCGDGWYTLIDQLCGKLQSMTDYNSHAPDRFPQIVASQIKEKYGGLRFYVEGASDWQDGVISFAEYLSESTCEVCGNPGAIDHDSSWLSCRCPSCRSAKNA